MLILILLPLFVGSECHCDGVYYYDNIQDAFLDIDNQHMHHGARHNNINSEIVVVCQDNTCTVRLLRDVVVDSPLILNGVNFDLNGFVLENNTTTLISTYGTCRIYNGRLKGSLDNGDNYDGLLVNRQSVCAIENIEFDVESAHQTNILVHAYGNIVVMNSSMEVSTLASNEAAMTTAVYGNIFSNIYISKSDVVAKSDFGRVEGVYVGDTGKIESSSIIAYSNYRSNDVTFTSCSIGCNNSGEFVVNDCDIYGVHSGINSSGTLFVNGGTYRGYGHGGIYCSGVNNVYHIINSSICQDEMPCGYEDFGVGCMYGGLYVGGGQGRNNISVFVNNCVITADQNPVVLRGTSEEQNNSIYISNTTMDVKHIRVDNDTHRVYIGQGCNFDASHVDIQDVVKMTHECYCGNLCDDK